MKVLQKYSRRLLEKKAAAVNRNVKIIPLDQVKRIAILWTWKDEKAFNFLQDLFRLKPVIVRNLCYSDLKEDHGSNLFTRKDLNWLGFPSSGNVETFIQTKFDLLINVVTETCYPLEVITALSVASFKIGWDLEKSGFYDLSVDVTLQPDSLYLAEQIIHYLKKFAHP
jgi:hypothetical protein